MNFDEFCNETQIEELHGKENFLKNQQKNIKYQQKNSDYSAKNQNFENDSQKINEEILKKHIQKYQNMSQQELLNELLSETGKQRQNGSLDNKKLSEIQNSLMPLLDKEQQDRLKQLVDMLRLNEK